MNDHTFTQIIDIEVFGKNISDKVDNSAKCADFIEDMNANLLLMTDNPEHDQENSQNKLSSIRNELANASEYKSDSLATLSELAIAEGRLKVSELIDDSISKESNKPIPGQIDLLPVFQKHGILESRESISPALYSVLSSKWLNWPELYRSRFKQQIDHVKKITHYGLGDAIAMAIEITEKKIAEQSKNK